MNAADANGTTRDTSEKTRPSWYTLNPRHFSRSLIFRALLIGLVLISFSIAPLWRLLWYFPVYSARNFTAVKDMRGSKLQAWRWVVGKEIRIYQLPEIRPGRAEIIATGVRALLQDAGLDFTVKVLPMPRDVTNAYRDSLERKSMNGIVQPCINFARLESHLVELHAGDPHADMFIVNVPISECWWAHGMATFNSGLSLLEDDFVSPHLGKHESAHLLGYQYHDDFPLYVIGYRWEGFPWSRDTLMMLNGESNLLSPRDFDALRYFWRGMEKRLGMRFLTG